VSGLRMYASVARGLFSRRQRHHATYARTIHPVRRDHRRKVSRREVGCTGSGPAIRRGNETEVIKMDSYCMKCGRFRPLTSLGVMCRECLQRWRPTRGPRGERPSWLGARLQITG
jgi:hypothetical protein